MEDRDNLESESEVQVTMWGKKEALIAAARQLERYHIPYVWKYRDGKWAIFRRLAEEE